MAAMRQIRNDMNTYRVHAYNPTTAIISTTQVDCEKMEDAVDRVMKMHLPIYHLLKVQMLNEFKNWETLHQVAITPVEGRVETGSLKVNDDWCGYFIRGDNACGLAFDANEIEEWFENLPEEHRKGVWIQMNSLLSSIKEMSKCRNR